VPINTAAVTARTFQGMPRSPRRFGKTSSRDRFFHTEQFWKAECILRLFSRHKTIPWTSTAAKKPIRRKVMYFKHDFSELKGRSSIGLASNGSEP
jgi:hypothetical protein